MSESDVERISARNRGESLPRKRTALEEKLNKQFVDMRLQGVEAEFKFHPAREWRWDFAWPALKLAVEVDGLVVDGKGGHQTIDGITKDYEKASEGMLLGWRVFRCTRSMVDDGTAAAAISLLVERLKFEIRQ